jgi:hypothetical protein
MLLYPNKFFRNTRLEKHVPLGAPPNPGGINPITGNTFAAGAAGPAVTPALAQGLQGCFGLQYAETTLTSAQILLLQTTPVTLVPAPGVGFWINAWYVIMRLIAGSVAYTDAGGAVSIGAGTLTTALASNAIFLVSVSPNTRKQVLLPYAAAAGTGVTDTAANPPTSDNAALAISKITNQFAAGNGTMHISVYYTIETTV